MRPAIAAAVWIAGIATAFPGASDDPGSRILDSALRGSGAHADLVWMCDRIGPRLSGSPQLEVAVEWGAERLRAGGADRVWTEPVTVPKWVRGEETGKII